MEKNTAPAPLGGTNSLNDARNTSRTDFGVDYAKSATQPPRNILLPLVPQGRNEGRQGGGKGGDPPPNGLAARLPKRRVEQKAHNVQPGGLESFLQYRKGFRLEQENPQASPRDHTGDGLADRPTN